MGRPAETILDFAQKHDIDRSVMASHGRTCLGRWVYGSVADKVLRAAIERLCLFESAGLSRSRHRRETGRAICLEHPMILEVKQ